MKEFAMLGALIMFPFKLLGFVWSLSMYILKFAIGLATFLISNILLLIGAIVVLYVFMQL
ncbi:MAG: hypothetical protein MRY32_00810 [Rickettsiales bacterium]|nr:hypothetical protein [Rickettsiales bacterium]